MSELTTLFQNTADAIRSKTGDTAAMKASQFPAKIQGISVGISQDEADARYLQLSGGTMTGSLILNGAPTADNQAATKAYVDANAGGVTKTLIWSNPTPKAEFAYQTVTPTVAVDNPLMYLIVFNASVPYGNQFTFTILPEMATHSLCSSYFDVTSGDVWCAGRGVQLTTAGAFAFVHAHFHETTTKAGVQNNKYIVPMEIYALK